MDFESDDCLVAFAGYLVAFYSVDQIGPCPSLQNSVQTVAKFTILDANQSGQKSPISRGRRGKIAHDAKRLHRDSAMAFIE